MEPKIRVGDQVLNDVQAAVVRILLKCSRGGQLKIGRLPTVYKICVTDDTIMLMPEPTEESKK